MIKNIPIDHPKIFSTCKNSLDKGGIVIYPTDTLYGFGVDARNETAIKKLNSIKGRSSPISIIVENIEQLVTFTNLSKEKKKFIKENIGNKTTFILPSIKGNVHKSVMSSNNFIGFRIPENTIGPKLVSVIGYPITSSSVNRHGNKPMNNPKKIIDEFGDEVDIIINAGVLPTSSGSTIYMLRNNQFQIIRR